MQLKAIKHQVQGKWPIICIDHLGVTVLLHYTFVSYLLVMTATFSSVITNCGGYHQQIDGPLWPFLTKQ